MASNERVGIRPYPSMEGYRLYEGERSELVFITQLMLNAIMLNYDLPKVPVSGIYDAPTSAAVKQFQTINRLPLTGEIDSVTWDTLAEDYNLTVNDNQ